MLERSQKMSVVNERTQPAKRRPFVYELQRPQGRHTDPQQNAVYALIILDILVLIDANLCQSEKITRAKLKTRAIKNNSIQSFKQHN